MLVVGLAGSGKSVLLAHIALQFRRYPASKVFALDFGGSNPAAARARQRLERLQRRAVAGERQAGCASAIDQHVLAEQRA